MSSQFAFPNYNDGQRTNANSDSAALNKWLIGKIGEGYTTHSFRHSMRDRLRTVECPSDVIDQIGGWLAQGVGASYSLRHNQKVLSNWLFEITNMPVLSGPLTKGPHLRFDLQVVHDLFNFPIDQRGLFKLCFK